IEVVLALRFLQRLHVGLRGHRLHLLIGQDHQLLAIDAGDAGTGGGGAATELQKGQGGQNDAYCFHDDSFAPVIAPIMVEIYAKKLKRLAHMERRNPLVYNVSCAPSSTTRLGGSLKCAVTLSALRTRPTNRFLRR